MRTETKRNPLEELKRKAEKGSCILENQKKTPSVVYVSEMGALLNEVMSAPDRNKAFIDALCTMYEAGVNAGYMIGTRSTRNTRSKKNT